MRRKTVLFSPIVYAHDMAMVHDLPKDADWWLGFNQSFQALCDETWVLMLPGWEDSAGVEREIALAQELGQLITYVQEHDGD